MQEHHVFANTPPYLEKFNSLVWYEFTEAYAGYKARGGVRSVKQLISTSVLRLISLRVSDLADVDDDDFMAAVSKVFSGNRFIESILLT